MSEAKITSTQNGSQSAHAEESVIHAKKTNITEGWLYRRFINTYSNSVEGYPGGVMARKMILVDPRMLEQRYTPPDALKDSLRNLDGEMNTVLDREDLSSRDKARLYQKTLRQYLTRFDQYQDRPLWVVNVHQPTVSDKEEIEDEPSPRKKPTPHQKTKKSAPRQKTESFYKLRKKTKWEAWKL